MAKISEQKIRSSDTISTVVGVGTRIRGSINIINSGRIDGQVDGGVTSDQDIIVGEGGYVKGHIISKRAIIGGRVEGSITAKKKLILESNADLEGDIKTKLLRVADGARFNGKAFMVDEKPEESK
jgi:cytoskeletal protein CcmA (bactofilin family)